MGEFSSNLANSPVGTLVDSFAEATIKCLMIISALDSPLCNVVYESPITGDPYSLGLLYTSEGRGGSSVLWVEFP